MNKIEYPLGHSLEEVVRLESQALLLREPVLEALASQAGHCLEIGCGSGANWPWLKRANPRLKYTGIDKASQAVAVARAKFGQEPGAEFLVMDGGGIAFNESSFDLVFTKLALWCIGPLWEETLRQVRRLLKPGGVFYALEPCNQLIQWQPQKPAAQKWMRLWDEAAIGKGLDPCIGTKIPGALVRAGFEGVQAKFHPVAALGAQGNDYEAVVSNLKGFYFGEAAIKLCIDNECGLAREAVRAMSLRRPDSLVMDALFASWGVKGS
ncbi:MAG: class I SAM-dependent methyltransferase [Elusimicrobia bacterium]|nr:class I SAM-dependent methyltransferase [Elusimicrobiota bacterium]